MSNNIGIFNQLKHQLSCNCVQCVNSRKFAELIASDTAKPVTTETKSKSIGWVWQYESGVISRDWRGDSKEDCEKANLGLDGKAVEAIVKPEPMSDMDICNLYSFVKDARGLAQFKISIRAYEKHLGIGEIK